MSFKNKVVLITGSGSGIGESAAILFAENGADLVIVDYNQEAANEAAEKCKKYGNKVLVIKADVSKDDDLKQVIEKTIKEFDRIDVLVNNAGIMRRGNLLSGNIMESFDQIININLRAVVHLTSLATPYLIKSKGCIVNTSSAASIVPHKAPGPVYAISKSGLDCFTRLTALELAPHGVRANTVNPGPVYTKIMENAGIDFSFKEVGKDTALGDSLDPKEIADMIFYLASDKAKGITGCNYLIDNGLSIN